MNNACLLVLINGKWDLKLESSFQLCSIERVKYKPFKTKVIHSFNKNKYL